MSVAVPQQRVTLLVPRQSRRRASLRVALQLAPGEARRLLLHPVFLAGFTLNVVLVAVVADNGPRDSFGTVSAGSTFYSGVFAYFAAHLATTRTRRSGSGELLAPLPATEHERTLAMLLAALAPALANLALVLSSHVLLTLRGLYLVEPGAAHLAQGPLTVLGGALLGVMVARWAPLPGAAALVMVGMFAWNMYVGSRPSIAPLGTFMNWATYGPGTAWVGLEPGSPAWHATYLALLGAMAATGAVLVGTPHRLRVLALGVTLTALAAGAGWAALP